jgi:Cache 3/Cache 2 fusion domain
MNRRHALIGIVAVAASPSLLGSAHAQDVAAKVHQSMDVLKADAAKLGAPKVDGTDTVAGKTVPAIYFGSTKINNNFDLVDAVVKQMGGTATIFVKSGAEYVRVSTNVPGSVNGRAIGTILDPNGKAIASINKNEAFYGDVDILGKPYTTGYEPIHDASGAVIGIYYVGYAK